MERLKLTWCVAGWKLKEQKTMRIWHKVAGWHWTERKKRIVVHWICGGSKPLQPKWIKVRSQLSFAWLSSEGKIIVNEASTETPHHTTLHLLLFTFSLRLYPKAVVVHFGSSLHRHLPHLLLLSLQAPQWGALLIWKVIKYRHGPACPGVMSPCCLSDDEGHFELGGWDPRPNKFILTGS